MCVFNLLCCPQVKSSYYDDDSKTKSTGINTWSNIVYFGFKWAFLNGGKHFWVAPNDYAACVAPGPVLERIVLVALPFKNM